jgi:hypothetical protein
MTHPLLRKLGRAAQAAGEAPGEALRQLRQVVAAERWETHRSASQGEPQGGKAPDKPTGKAPTSKPQPQPTAGNAGPQGETTNGA